LLQVEFRNEESSRGCTETMAYIYMWILVMNRRLSATFNAYMKWNQRLSRTKNCLKPIIPRLSKDFCKRNKRNC
jgi:hypothetical protein